MYELGRGVVKDELQALSWFRKAADQGEAVGQLNLGHMYASGRGVLKDPQQAMFLYRKAADRGLTPAQVSVAAMYERGEGVVKDEQQAYFWYLLASIQGNTFVIGRRDLIESRLTPQQRTDAQREARAWSPR